MEKEKDKYNVLETILDIISAIAFVYGIVNAIYIALIAIFTIVFGCVCKKIGLSKGIDTGFLWGWFFGIIGLLIICVLPSNISDNENRNKDYNKYDDLEKLAKLKEQGILTETEFEIEKDKLLK